MILSKSLWWGQGFRLEGVFIGGHYLFGFCESVGIKISEVLDDFILLFLGKIGVDEVAVYDCLDEVPQNLGIYGLGLCISDIK